MKIKSDFVTNSSSTCYIVLIPPSFEVDKEKLKNLYDKFTYYNDRDSISFDDMLKEFDETIQILKKGERIYLDDFGNELHVVTFNSLEEYLKDFYVNEIKLSTGGETSITGISMDKVFEIILNSSDIRKLM